MPKNICIRVCRKKYILLYILKDRESERERERERVLLSPHASLGTKPKQGSKRALARGGGIFPLTLPLAKERERERERESERDRDGEGFGPRRICSCRGYS